MSHTHGKQHKGQHAGSARDRAAPIGMVKQRAGIATILVFGVVLLFVLAVLAVAAWWLFG